MKALLYLIFLLLFYSPKGFTQVCKDSSTSIRYFCTEGRLEIRNQNSIADAGIIATGFIREPAFPLTSGFIVKLNVDKSIVWSKKITSGNDTTSIELFDARQFKDGNIVAAGILTNNTTLYRSIIIYKFNMAGTLIWQKNIQAYNTTNFELNLFIDAVAEGLNNEILLSARRYTAGFGSYIYSTIFKLDINGSIIWDNTFSNSYFDISSFHPNPAIISGLYPYDNSLFCIGGPFPVIMKLNYATGAFDTGRFVNYSQTVSATYIASERYFTTSLVKNKHFSFTGESAYFTAANEMFSVLFDENLSPVKCLKINALNMPYGPSSSARKNIITTYGDTTLISMPVDKNLFFAALTNTSEIIQQRKIFNAEASFGYVQKNLINSTADDLAVIISQNPESLQNGFELFQLQDYSNSYENCIGINDPHISIQPLLIDSGIFSFRTQLPNSLLQAAVNSSVSDVIFTKQVLCTQVSICDSVTITGSDTVCHILQPVTFVAKRRNDCLKRISWNIDSSAVSSIQHTNDSTVTVVFKDSWSGYIYASVNACTLIKDSFKITVYNTPENINLGNDSSLCNNNSLLLNAKKGFKNYTWQDGSTDSVFLAAQTGKYYVTAYNYCGEKYSDSINLEFHSAPVIELGRDTGFCENENVVFNAGMGFISYLWNTGATSPAIRVNQTGTYSVIATDSNHCISSDSIKVLQLFSQPEIKLPKNSAVCIGQSNLIDAGSGFQKYLWQDGSADQTIIINRPGKYKVTVTTSDGCSNSDSLVIKHVIPPPAGFLFRDTIICKDATIILKANRAFADYLWSDNSKLPSLQIESEGVYWIKVKDYYGCVGSDTVKLSHRDCPGIFYMPNTFTPNGDNLNDILKPFIDGVLEQYRLSIYNKWGELIFSSAQINSGWNGTFKNSNQDNGVYTWVCTYQLKNKSPKLVKGTVILLR